MYKNIVCSIYAIIKMSRKKIFSIFMPLALHVNFSVNSLRNNEFLDWYILKAFADDKRNVTQKSKF